jgi:Ca2+-transporting ATPase
MLGALFITMTLQLLVIYLPFFNGIFKTHPLTWQELGITIAVSSIVFWAVEIEKFIKHRRINRQRS